MAPSAICPTCETPTLDGICRQCAFSAALVGVASNPSAHTPPPANPAAPPGYELLHEIGRGATAVVWLARERKLDRLVALKFISGAADRRLRQRLIREGQAAARLRHPNIVAVHAMGATDDHAFLAMDYLEGGDLRQRLARSPSTTRASAELVQLLAGALAHAHAHGVLHRDIKASNVLLDAQHQPHLSDFGLAAPLEGGGDLTLPGQVVGTAAYLAPELLQGADHAAPASDVYSVGVVLYECLTARLPFLGDSSAAIFAQLATAEPPAPRLLRPDIPRDLETICLKCLEKSPARRYSSAEALHEDLGHFLRREPIAARPVTAIGKTIRWCRRHPATAISTGIAAVLVLSLAIGGPLVALRLARTEARAETEAATSKAVSDFLQDDLLAQASPNHQPDRDLKLRTVLDRAAKNIETRFPQQPLVEARIRRTLASTYSALGDYATAQRHAERTVELFRAQFGDAAAPTLSAINHAAELLLKQGKSADAEKRLRPNAEALQRTLGPEHADTLHALTLLGRACTAQGKYAEGEAIHRAGLATRRRVFGAEHEGTLDEINALAITYARLVKYTEAETLNRELMTVYQRKLGPDHPETQTATSNLSVNLYFLDRLAEAEELQRAVLATSRRVLGNEHPDTLVTIGLLANTLQGAGKLAEAEALHREALEPKKRILGPTHGGTIGTMNNLALTFLDQKKFPEAEALYKEVIQAIERQSGSDARGVFPAKQGLAKAYSGQSRFAEAEAVLIPTVSGAQRVLGPTHPGTLQCQEDLGVALLRQGKLAEAEITLRETLAGRTTVDATGWRTAATRSILGDVLSAAKRFAEAEPLLVESHEDLRRQAAKIPLAKRYATRAAERLQQFYRNSNQQEKAQALEQSLAGLATK